MNMSYSPTQQRLPSAGPSIPQTRTSFLKDTAQMIKRMTNIIHHRR
jgi:hypothetical protein